MPNRRVGSIGDEWLDLGLGDERGGSIAVDQHYDGGALGVGDELGARRSRALLLAGREAGSQRARCSAVPHASITAAAVAVESSGVAAHA